MKPRTIVIAARDASQTLKDVADFVCTDDVPDHITFGLAMDALGEDGGILKPYGTFDLTPGDTK